MQEESSGGLAKERYDRKRPVVSFRVSRKQLAKLEELIRGSGISKGRFVRRALGLELEKKDRIYRKGRRDGYRKAKKRYRVDVLCGMCGGPILVKDDDMKTKVCKAVGRTYNWFHRDCKPGDCADDECELFDREIEDE